MTAALRREIDTLPAPEHPLSAAEKSKSVGELERRLDELERIEEASIENAQAAGFDAARRVDASPAAILNVVVVAPKMRAQARAA